MKISIDELDIKKLKALKNTKINYYLTLIDNIDEEKAVDFMEFLYDKSNEYLDKDYKDTPESILLEKIADYIYDKTK